MVEKFPEGHTLPCICDDEDNVYLHFHHDLDASLRLDRAVSRLLVEMYRGDLRKLEEELAGQDGMTLGRCPKKIKERR